MFRTQNLCTGSKNVFDSRQKHFLFPQHMFPAQLNWETFALFPILARPLASTSGTAPTTSQIKDLIGQVSRNKRAARAARA